jgi:uncharacterized protein YodC (DUF2158 family)
MFKVGDKVRVKKCSPECTCFEHPDPMYSNIALVGAAFYIIEILGHAGQDSHWFLGPLAASEDFHVDDLFLSSHKSLGSISNPAHMEIFP